MMCRLQYIGHLHKCKADNLIHYNIVGHAVLGGSAAEARFAKLARVAKERTCGQGESY